MAGSHPPDCLCDECLDGVLAPVNPAAGAAELGPSRAAAAPDSLEDEIQEVARTLAAPVIHDRPPAPVTTESEEALATDLADVGHLLDCGRAPGEPECRLGAEARCAACAKRIEDERLHADLDRMDEEIHHMPRGGEAAVEPAPPLTIDLPEVPPRVDAPIAPAEPGTVAETLASARSDLAAAQDDLADLLAELRALNQSLND